MGRLDALFADPSREISMARCCIESPDDPIHNLKEFILPLKRNPKRALA